MSSLRYRTISYSVNVPMLLDNEKSKSISQNNNTTRSRKRVSGIINSLTVLGSIVCQLFDAGLYHVNSKARQLNRIE